MLKNPVRLAVYGVTGWIPGGSRFCAICEHKVWRFMPYQFGASGPPRLMEAVGCVGSDTTHFECPHCGCNDRERHLLLYLRARGLLHQMHGASILHFAPEKRLSKYIIAAKPKRYIRCDLYPNAPNIERVDLLDMPYDDGSFDFLIANHVLEHVADDRRALSEVHRVLRRGGHAILQTPYSSKLHHTWQDEGVDTDAARLQAYGQRDHVRLFGRDIFARFTSTGLVSCVTSHGDLVPDANPTRFGVNPNEPFFMFRKDD